MSIFTEDIKNSRFFLALSMIGMLGLCIIGDAALVYYAMETGKTVDATVFGAFTTAIAIIGTSLASAFGSYFRDQAEADKTAAEAELVKAQNGQ